MPPTTPISFPDDTEMLERTIHDRRVSWWWSIRSVASCAGPTDAMRSPHDARRAVDRRSDRTLRHLRKSSRGPAIYAGLGGIGVAAPVRLGLIVAKVPSDSSAMVLASYKLNMGERPPSLKLAITKGANGHGRIEWLDKCPHSADDLIEKKPSRDADDSAWGTRKILIEVLSEHGETVWVDVRKSARRSSGIATCTLERAAKDLVTSRRQGFGGR